MPFLIYSNIVDPLLKNVRREVIQVSGAGPGKKVLDVCCGTGDQVFYYGKTGAEAVGIDKRMEMIETAETRGEKESIKNVSFVKADAANIPFPDNFFDIASVSLGLHEMEREERYKAVAEMKRVTKKEGILIFIDFISPLPKNLLSVILTTVEYLAGRQNYECFKQYLKGGGLPTIMEKHRLSIELSENLNGIICLIKAKIS